jgi:hypothetical protein
MDIDQKSIGFLIDELITTSMKCWFAQETIMNTDDEEKLAIAAKKAQLLNARRNAIIRAIDKRLGEEDISPTDKTYA